MSTPGVVAVAEDLAPHLEALERAVDGASPEQLPDLAGRLGRITALVQLRIAGVGREVPKAPDRILDAEEVASRMGRSKSWVYAHQGELREARANVPGNGLKFSERKLEKLLEGRGR